MIFLPLLFVLQTLTHASFEFEIRGINNSIILNLQNQTFPPTQTLINITTTLILANNQSCFQYTGGDYGVSTINNLGSKMVIVSENEMKAYGWCYLVDGVESGLMANEFVVGGGVGRVEWFYAYAHWLGTMTEGTWVSMCDPA